MQTRIAKRKVFPEMDLHTEYRIIRPSGEVRHIKDHSFPIFDENQIHIGFVGIARDVTDEVIMAQHLIEAKSTEAANRAKTEFLANMSHDVKTPLTGVVTMADIMVHDNTARDVDRQCAEIIFSSGQQIVSLFNSCLDLSKMEVQEWTSKTEIFSLKQLLNDIHVLFVPKAISNHLIFNIEYDETLPKIVEGHRESLYRVLLNLVGNAMKFTEQGSVSLRVLNIKQIDDQYVNVEFQVQDTGMGIPEDKHQVIFEKLHRLTPSYARKIEGSGMGLYIVDEYVKRLGGEIQVKSKVGEGSTFIVSLSLKIVFETTCSQTTVQPSTTSMTETHVQKIMLNDVIESTKVQEVGLFHLKKTVQHMNAQWSIKSVINQSTTVESTVDITSTPVWTCDVIKVYSDDIIVILDDDQSIHGAWEEFFSTYLQKYPLIKILHFTQGQACIDYINSCQDKNNILLLADYELINQDLNGLDVVAATSIQRAVLVVLSKLGITHTNFYVFQLSYAALVNNKFIS